MSEIIKHLRRFSTIEKKIPLCQRDFQHYQPYENDILKCFKPKTECLVIQAFDGDLLVTIGEKIYELRKLEKHEKYSKDFDNIPEIKKEKKKHILPMSHPWKLASFKQQMKKAHTQRVYA